MPYLSTLPLSEDVSDYTYSPLVVVHGYYRSHIAYPSVKAWTQLTVAEQTSRAFLNLRCYKLTDSCFGYPYSRGRLS